MTEFKPLKGIFQALLRVAGKTILGLFLALLGLLAIFTVIYSLAYPQPPSRVDVSYLVGTSVFPMLLFGMYAVFSTRLGLMVRALAFLGVATGYIFALFMLYGWASFIVWFVGLLMVGDVLEATLRRFLKPKIHSHP